MKELLTKLKAALQQGISYVRPQDVYITADLNLIPNGVMAPAFGLKDGPIRRSEKAGGMWEVVMTVQVGLFAKVLKPEASVMGDPASGQKGVLDLQKDLHALLDENLLGIIGMQAAFSPSEAGSETVGNESEMFQRKIVSYEFTKEEERP